MNPEEATTNIPKSFDLDKDYDLPYYHCEDSAAFYLCFVAELKQKPLGVVWVGYKKWQVVFKYSREIKYIYKYIEEWEDYSEKELNELYKQLSPKEKIYYNMLAEIERREKEAEA